MALGKSTTLNVPYHYTPITPSNFTDFPSLTRGIYVGSEGDVSVVRYDGTVVTFSNVAAGSVLPVSARRVNASGTTASGLCALFGRLERDVPFTPNTFSPLDLSPVLWLDAADTSTITEVSGSVSQWDDKSGNGHHVTQGTAALQPNTGTKTINGLNAVEFIADYMTGTVSAESQPNTLILVVDRVVTPTNGIFVDGIHRFGGTTTPTEYFNAGTILSGTHTPSVDPTIHLGISDGASSNYYVNGSLSATGNAGTANIAAGTFAVGGSTAGAFLTAINIGEVILYPDALSATDQTAVEAYLADKWGITL